MRSPRRLLIPILCCGVVAACGVSSNRHAALPTGPPAKRVCNGDLHAAAAVLSGVRLRILNHDPTNIECLIFKGSLRVDMVAQASELAWTLYDTAQVHLIQAFGTGTVHVQSELPRQVAALGGNSLWVPAEQELLATNGTQSRGGNYVTVKVKDSSSGLAIATAVARATLRLAPRGSNPPAPS